MRLTAAMEPRIMRDDHDLEAFEHETPTSGTCIIDLTARAQMAP
jgi:hypothetical protein